MIMEKWPIGVFASIDAGLGVKMDVVRELGIPTIQLHAPEKEGRTSENAEQFKAKMEEYGIAITTVFLGFAGESYETMEKAAQSGLVPTETRAERLSESKQIADFTNLLGVDSLGMHVGFVPHDKNDPNYQGVVEAVQEICDYIAQYNQALHLETGQESAENLLSFIDDVGRDNLFINFDPANMILYGAGNPIEALKKVGHKVRSVHCKDGKWSDKPGVEFGMEVPFGQGDVDAELFLKTLKELGYDGALTIEREIPQDPERQKAEIAQAVELIQQIKQKIGV
jgi:sugar phosphate isomerase/epimerase